MKIIKKIFIILILIIIIAGFKNIVSAETNDINIVNTMNSTNLVTNLISDSKINPTDNSNIEFISAENTEVSLGNDIVININLDNIEYEKFYFTISANWNVDNVKTNSENLVEEINTNEESNEYSMLINKNKISSNKIAIYYKIPDNASVGSFLNIKATIGEDEKNILNENNITINIINQKEEINNNKYNNENSEISKNQENNILVSPITMIKEAIAESTNNSKSLSVGTTISNISLTSGNSVSTANAVTYKGSSNTYLSKLTVDGYENSILPNFKKTNATYFITLKNNEKSLNINAIADESTSKVCISGNADLASGKKVLITVTSESGSTRVYRIFIK